MRSVLGTASSEATMNKSVWFKERTSLIIHGEVDWAKGFRFLIIYTIGNRQKFLCGSNLW